MSTFEIFGMLSFIGILGALYYKWKHQVTMMDAEGNVTSRLADSNLDHDQVAKNFENFLEGIDATALEETTKMNSLKKRGFITKWYYGDKVVANLYTTKNDTTKNDE